uniref:COesterase domain-containing protein n=1 Tax=Strongyloides venezuelensis TaxID=75913 RepID=A0A0K0FS34_STRVS
MIGRTVDEATFFMATGFTNNSKYGCYFYPQLPVSHANNSCVMNETNFANLVSFGSSILKLDTQENSTLFQIYKDSATTYTNRSIRILSDFIFDCDLSRFAKTYVEATQKNVYLYEYARRSPINKWPLWTGAMHGDDLVNIFGIPFRHPEKYKCENKEKEEKNKERNKREGVNKNKEKKTKCKDSVEEEQNYSEQVMWAIGNFSKTGKPNTVWEKASEDSLRSFIFNGTSSFVHITHQNFTPPTCNEFFNLMKQFMIRKMQSQAKTSKKVKR